VKNKLFNTFLTLEFGYEFEVFIVWLGVCPN